MATDSATATLGQPSVTRRLRIVIAPDSFKGTLSAVQAAEAMARGLRQVLVEAELREVPIADGGEGTVEAVVVATRGVRHEATVTGPRGEPVRAVWGELGDGRTAVIEVAAASGLALVPPEARDPRFTTTRGTGELIHAALDAGLRHFVIGLGGSATNDAGVGALRALGLRCLDAEGSDLPEGGAALASLARIDTAGLDPRWLASDIQVACDVTSPLCGPHGAAAIFAPQKGATPEQVVQLDQALARFAACARVATGREVAEVSGAGAAGGFGAGLLFFSPAIIRPGIDVVLQASDFAAIVRDADLVLTGEGCTDAQTALGKAPVGVARVAREFGVPVICLSGCLGDGAEAVLQRGVTALVSVGDRPVSPEACQRDAAAKLTQAASRLGPLIESILRKSASGALG